MPELPEVHTTATGLQRVLPGLHIVDVWTDYNSSFHAGKHNIKNPTFFKTMRTTIIGKKILRAHRRAKNVLIDIEDGNTILIHMKMTGHVLYGEYKKKKNTWIATKPGPLRDDPFNAWIHFVITLSNGKHVALSDMRKFAKVTLLPTKTLTTSTDLAELGPEPVTKDFTFAVFKERLLKRPTGKIKSVLMDQTLIAGIGNIYSDEILWYSGVHPESRAGKLPDTVLKTMYRFTQHILRTGIDFGGDSMSDYRNIDGKAGAFQHKHNAYRRTGERCRKRGCGGTIHRKVIGGRSAHFCNNHQILL